MPVAAVLMPDLSWFLDSNSDALCANGLGRPCAVRLRDSPHVDGSNFVNLDPNYVGRTNYPVEPYGSDPGTPLAGVCQFFSDEVKSATPPNTEYTSKWYVVRLQAQYILNPVVQEEAQQPAPPFHVIKDSNGQVLEVDVFMSAAWAQGHGSLELPSCNSIELASAA